MCGFAVHTKGYNDYFVRRRGQDMQTNFGLHGFTFSHHLLSITGKKQPQPFIDGEIVAIYNGEIYNHDFVKSDGENIIPLYRKYGFYFPKYLDGEFAIVLFDFENDLAIYITDPFATKPIWVNGLEAASYQSALGGVKVPANTIIVKSIITKIEIQRIEKYHNFDFSNQHKDTYDDCLKAFSHAIKKRSKENCFLGLSSGYDSGAICCELIKQGVKFKAYSVLASEDKIILSKRLQFCNENQLIINFDQMLEQKHLDDNCENFNYDYYYDGQHITKSYKNDWAARGLSQICRLAKLENRKVYLSGQGADEILSDYALIPKQSELFGIFPNNLKEWTNFYNGCQYSYLGKEECVAGSWNVETRYPFLDRDFVQEFLWLKPELKNKKYKALIFEYLKANGFPFAENKKIGFC